MPYKKNFQKKGFKRDDNRHYHDEVGGNPGRPPVTDGGGSYNDMLSVKALKDLPKSPVSLLADPYASALPGTMPYPLLNKFNKVMGGRYSGDRNIDGGNVRQYANTYNTGFLSIFDSAVMRLQLNYRYLPIASSDTDRGYLMIDEMRKAIDEACSVLGSTIFVNQNIYNYAVETDLPMGSAKKITVYDFSTTETPDDLTDYDVVEKSGSKTYYHKRYLYNNISDVLYSMGIMYQIYIQSVVLAFNQFNSFRLKQGEMIRMSFNRETPALNSYFGLMNKKAFLSLWDSLAYTVEGEYVDQDFMVQTNVLGMIASRRSESLNDALLEICSTFNFPDNFKLLATNVKATNLTPANKNNPIVSTEVAFNNPVFDMNANMKYTNAGEQTTTFYEACNDLMIKMTANNTLEWARTLASSNVSDNDRYNACKNDLDTLTYCMTEFKTRFNDLRTVLDVMSRTGVNQWSKGLKLKVINDIDTTFFQNLVVDNIYSLVLSGCDRLTFDDITKRWSMFTMWDQYYGIPEHDAFMGGVFLTMSTKTLSIPEGSNSNIGYLPIAFNVITNSAGTLVKLLNRNGFTVPISYNVVTMSTNSSFARLVPLASQSNYQVRVPVVQLDNDYANYTPLIKSFVTKWMLQICRLGSEPTSAEATYSYHLDSDLFAVYDLQVEDFTNEVITYARSKSIFRANAADTSNLGFFGLRKDHK